MNNPSINHSSSSGLQAVGCEARSFVALMYHNICDDDPPHPDLSPSATSYFVKRQQFTAQLDQLPTLRARTLTFEELRAFYRDARVEKPRQSVGAQRHVLLTFDDGWKGSVEIAQEILAERGHQAIVFVTTGFLGKQYFLDRDGLRSGDRRVIQFGSHGRTHRMLSLLGNDEVREELRDSKRELEDLLGYEIDTVSIPSGAVNPDVRRIAAECGYRLIFDSRIRVNRRGDSGRAIGRVPVMQHTELSSYRRYVRQQLGREQVRRAVLSCPKVVLGLRRYEFLRRKLLGEKPGQAITHQS